MKKTPKAITAQRKDEMMNRKANIVRAMLAALVISAVFAGSASASPAWHFNGTELSGSETIVGGAEHSSMTISGLVTDCENFLYKVTIKNESKVGKGSLTEMPLYNCTTDSDACAVKSIGAEALPYPAELVTVTPSNYIVIKNVKVAVSYSGVECVLSGLAIKVTGTAGGRIDNGTESATFDSASFSATKTQLIAMGSPIEWKGVFPTEAFEWKREQALTVS